MHSHGHGEGQGAALPCLAATGRRWHAYNASVGYLDWTSFYLFHLHPPCGLLSRVKLDECKTSRSTYTEQIHTYPKLIHVCLGVSTLRGQAITAPTIDRLTFERSIFFASSLAFISICLQLSRMNSTRVTDDFSLVSLREKFTLTYPNLLASIYIFIFTTMNIKEKIIDIV